MILLWYISIEVRCVHFIFLILDVNVDIDYLIYLLNIKSYT